MSENTEEMVTRAQLKTEALEYAARVLRCVHCTTPAARVVAKAFAAWPVPRVELDVEEIEEGHVRPVLRLRGRGEFQRLPDADVPESFVCETCGYVWDIPGGISIVEEVASDEKSSDMTPEQLASARTLTPKQAYRFLDAAARSFGMTLEEYLRAAEVVE